MPRAPLLCCALLLLPRAALGHPLVVERALVLETEGADRLHALFRVKVPSGRPRQVLELLVDANKDGRLSEPELGSLERLLALRALDGVRIQAGTASVSLGSVEAKHELAPQDGPVLVMVHGVARVPPGPLRLVISTGVTSDPLDLTVLPGSRPARKVSRGRLDRGAASVRVGQGDRVEVELGP